VYGTTSVKPVFFRSLFMRFAKAPGVHGSFLEFTKPNSEPPRTIPVKARRRAKSQPTSAHLPGKAGKDG
jgi:hypothetical protein